MERNVERARLAAKGDRGLVLLGVGVVVLIATVLAFLVGRSTNDSPNDTIDDSSPIRVLPVQRAGDFDPFGDDGEESPDLVRRAIDGKLTTGWRTSTYLGSASLGGLKDGVGLVFDLGGPREVDSVRIQLGGTPTDLSIYIASPDEAKVPRSLKALRRVAVLDGAGVDASMSLESGEITRYLVVWLRKLPEVDPGSFRGEIREVVIRGRS
jgi:putative peptidoglycan lipid II flippase